MLLGTDNKAGFESVWTTIGDRVAAPMGTASVKFFLFDQKVGGPGDFTVQFDNAELLLVPEPSGAAAAAAAMATLVALYCWRRTESPAN